jgi:hypothetical protein
MDLLAWNSPWDNICFGACPYKVFRILSNRCHPTEQSVLMKVGTFSNPYIADFFCQCITVRKLIGNQGIEISQYPISWQK